MCRGLLDTLPASEPDREDWTNTPQPREKITIERVSFWVLINSLNIELPYRNNFACIEHLINIDTLIDFITGPLLKAIAYQNTRSLANYQTLSCRIFHIFYRYLRMHEFSGQGGK